MNIYFNRMPVRGPWGGGNKILTGLVDKCATEGHTVCFGNTSDIYDIIFCMDPRPNNSGVHYGHLHAYKERFGSKIIQRVGDVGTHGKPDLTQLVRQTVKHSDFLIFPSNYAKCMSKFQGKNYRIIRNRPTHIFQKHKRSTNNSLTDISLVTHHWSTNVKKGFETYAAIADKLPDNVSFTYVGRIPAGFQHDNIQIVSPLSGVELATEIAKHHVYVTASQEEAGANHVLEAMACGLPVLYMKGGGSIPEYVTNRGIEFDNDDNFLNALKQMHENYAEYEQKCFEYQETIDEAVDECYEIICNI